MPVMPGIDLRCGSLLEPDRHSVLDERLQPGQCVIPLLGNEIEVLSHVLNRCGVEFK